MSVELWILLWKTVLVGAVGLFGALAIAVTIGGAVDICRLLKSLREEHARSTAEKVEGGDAQGPQHLP